MGLLGLKGEVSGERCEVSFEAWGVRSEVRGRRCEEGGVRGNVSGVSSEL